MSPKIPGGIVKYVTSIDQYELVGLHVPAGQSLDGKPVAAKDLGLSAPLIDPNTPEPRHRSTK